MSKKPKRPPFSIKLTFKQRAALEVAANGMPLGTFIMGSACEDGFRLLGDLRA